LRSAFSASGPNLAAGVLPYSLIDFYRDTSWATGAKQKNLAYQFM
jgi:hypothetical protein